MVGAEAGWRGIPCEVTHSSRSRRESGDVSKDGTVWLGPTEKPRWLGLATELREQRQAAAELTGEDPASAGALIPGTWREMLGKRQVGLKDIGRLATMSETT